ncbi:hypothetical protein [Cecembia rubra]|uniref:Uncharacterized protein n=1 Tax=Cecembia rubra TaxID=1485585 RepID=A0A2P8EAQ0_9BACT|nr:hypothetical protein [Cecembia rubra]PSL06534.1 hypothetical protein CLV48_102351 [Cecembia rubra]
MTTLQIIILIALLTGFVYLLKGLFKKTKSTKGGGEKDHYPIDKPDRDERIV